MREGKNFEHCRGNESEANSNTKPTKCNSASIAACIFINLHVFEKTRTSVTLRARCVYAIVACLQQHENRYPLSVLIASWQLLSSGSYLAQRSVANIQKPRVETEL